MVNVQDLDGRIPLHIAAENGLCDIMKVLLEESGAREGLDKRDRNDNRPIDIAKGKEMVAMLPSD